MGSSLGSPGAPHQSYLQWLTKMIHSIIDDINYTISGRLYDVINMIFSVGQLYKKLKFLVIIIQFFCECTLSSASDLRKALVCAIEGKSG